MVEVKTKRKREEREEKREREVRRGKEEAQSSRSLFGTEKNREKQQEGAGQRSQKKARAYPRSQTMVGAGGGGRCTTKKALLMGVWVPHSGFQALVEGAAHTNTHQHKEGKSGTW